MTARPTYAEEFENIRDNVAKAYKPKKPSQLEEDWDNVSHYSKISVKRGNSMLSSNQQSPEHSPLTRVSPALKNKTDDKFKSSKTVIFNLDHV